MINNFELFSNMQSKWGKMDDYRLLRNRLSNLIDSAKNETYQMKI